jgi:hypothetical protein
MWNIFAPSMIKVKSLLCISQARTISLLALFILAFLIPAKAQNEKTIGGYAGQIISIMTETYDGSLIMRIVNQDSANGPVYLMKYTLNGKEVWKKKFNNSFAIWNTISTKDSGFIVAAGVNVKPQQSEADSAWDIALLKYDKCAKLQWAKYVPTPGYNCPINVIENNGDFYLCTLGINGWADGYRKPVTILKFSQAGALIRYKSFEGIYSTLFKNPNGDTMYINQSVYLPIDKDTALGYLFAGVQSMDTALNILNKIMIGYQDKIFNGHGPLIIKQNEIEALTDARLGTQQTMFSKWDKSLKPLGDGSFHYDSIRNHEIYAVSATHYQDTTFTYNLAQSPQGDSVYISLRLYDKDYKLIKESVINKNAYQFTSTAIQLKNNNFIVSSDNRSRQTGGSTNSSFFLYNSKLEGIKWPTAPPAKGYDWACKTSIPAFEVIDMDKVVKPVHVELDYSRPDWHWLTGINEPENPTIAKLENGWLVWPQPLSCEEPLHFKCMIPHNMLYNSQKLEIRFHDLQGKEVKTFTTIALDNGELVIPNFQVPTPGLYLAEIINSKTGLSLGRVKIAVK